MSEFEMSFDRYVPEHPFPAYAFVPGQHAHPVTNPQGHSFGRIETQPEPLDPSAPRSCSDFLYGVDLFNAGFYWEAHEIWEGLWIAAGRTGTTADFLKGLIKLAAAGVKSREGMATGVQRHAIRARQLFAHVSKESKIERQIYAGLRVDELDRLAAGLAERPVVDTSRTIGGHPTLKARLTIESSE